MVIYYYHCIDSFIEKGIVQDPKVKTAYKDTRFISKVDWENGTTSGAKLDHCFTTKEEAVSSRRVEQEKYIEELKNEITDLISLLEFSLKHDIRNGDFCDYSAQKVYKEVIERIKKGECKYLSGVGK